MNKHQPKPYEKNVRLSSPTGLIGVPPDTFCCCRRCCLVCDVHCRRSRHTITQ